MTTAAPVSEQPARSGLDCRVHERYECQIEASCQPFVAQASCEMAWSGKIRNISIDGVGLELPRRFEPGAGLSIELPSGDENIPSDIFIAKVIHAQALPDRRWLLGCQFLSQLSEDHLQSLIDLALAQEKTRQPPKRNNEPNQLEIILLGPSFRRIRPKLRIRQFRCDSEWPLPVGKVLKMRIGDSGKLVSIRVRETTLHRGQWIVRYGFVETPTMDDLIRFGWRP